MTNLIEQIAPIFDAIIGIATVLAVLAVCVGGVINLKYRSKAIKVKNIFKQAV